MEDNRSFSDRTVIPVSPPIVPWWDFYETYKFPNEQFEEFRQRIFSLQDFFPVMRRGPIHSEDVKRIAEWQDTIYDLYRNTGHPFGSYYPFQMSILIHAPNKPAAFETWLARVHQATLN